MIRAPRNAAQRAMNQIQAQASRRIPRDNQVRLPRNELPAQRSNRLAVDRQRHSTARTNEDPAQRQDRLASDRQRHTTGRANETPEQRQARLARNREYARNYRRNRNVPRQNAVANADPEANPPGNTLHLAAILDDQGKLRFGVPEEDYLGPMDQACSNCGALHFRDERERSGKSTYSECCMSGQMDPDLFNLTPYPPRMQQLFDDQDFLDNIRDYNAAMSMGSLSYKPARVNTPGPRIFKVQGLVYHVVHNINGGRSEVAGNYGIHNQLWILDTAEATELRQRRCPRLKQLHLHVLKQQLESANRQLYGTYRSLYRQVVQNPSQYVFRFDKRPSRNFSLPSTREIAAVMVENSSDTARGVYVYHERGNLRQFFDYKEGVCDALTYPVLLPHGDVAWHVGRRANNRNTKKVTLMHYYGYMTSVRPGFNPILQARDLFQQYLVDAYSKVLKNRLDYIATHQKSLWAEEFKRLQNLQIVDADGRIDQDLLQQHVGQRKFIPSSVPDTRRFMERKYDDAMGVVARFGKPDLFITFTCNTKWREIQEALLPGQKPEHRPDIVNKVCIVLCS